MIISERVQSAINNPHPPDCYASALYITGKIQQENSPQNILIECLSHFIEIKSPEVGCIVSL